MCDDCKPRNRGKRKPKPGNCQNCGVSSTDLVFGKYCKSCRRFEQKHGRLPEKHERIIYARGWVPCKNCKQHRTHIKGRCIACHSYWRRHGKERPRYMEADTCLNCAVPLDRTTEATRNYGGKGLCSACYDYQLIYNIPRPERLWNRGEYGYCDCGKPATHKITIQVHRHQEELAMCAGCYAIEQQHKAWYGTDKLTGNLQQGKRLDLYGDD